MADLEFERTALVKAVERGLVERGLVEQARDAAELRLSTPGGRFQVRSEDFKVVVASVSKLEAAFWDGFVTSFEASSGVAV